MTDHAYEQLQSENADLRQRLAAVQSDYEQYVNSVSTAEEKRFAELEAKLVAAEQRCELAEMTIGIMQQVVREQRGKLREYAKPDCEEAEDDYRDETEDMIQYCHDEAASRIAAIKAAGWNAK